MSLTNDRLDWQNLKYDLESKLQDAQSLNQNLQEQLNRVKAEKASGENRGVNGGGDRGYDELQQEHERLKAELREQEEVRSFVAWVSWCIILICCRSPRKSAEKLWSF